MNPTILFLGTADGLVIYTVINLTGNRTTHVLHGQAITALSALDAETLLVSIADTTALQSFDGGQNWMPAPTPPEPIGLRAATRDGPVALANPRLMAATAYTRLPGKNGVLLGAGAGGTMLFRSGDDGIHWEPAALPGPIGRINSLAPDAHHTAWAWAGAADGQLLLTTDAGRSWQIAACEPTAILCVVSVT